MLALTKKASYVLSKDPVWISRPLTPKLVTDDDVNELKPSFGGWQASRATRWLQ